ncbi:retrovirus-related Pol polyprotein from transposon 17.6 [Trichonephila clavipes]|nr:retrovirus-related Pol polyprotein from transposon 17.6 [Trichonephila clavipes]
MDATLQKALKRHDAVGLYFSWIPIVPQLVLDLLYGLLLNPRVEEHKEKILTEFSLPDFIAVANLLHLDVETNEQNLCNSIFKALTNLDEFQLILNNSETSYSEGENVVSETTFQKRITLDKNFSSEGIDQHSPFQHPVSNASLPSVQENGRLFPSRSKTKAVINYPDLKNTKDVRQFLGLTGYFRKFLPSYSTIAKPLSDLLRKDSLFQFYAEQQTAFQKLKYLLFQEPVLSIFNQNSPTEIHTDVSIDGLGAVLLQKSIHDNQFHPVLYMSKKTSDHERKYTGFELEVLAVVEALRKFRIYVLGTSFKIITDCDALVKTLSKKELNPRIARWALYLQEFNYTIEHRTGSKMAHVDALSRPPHCMLIQNSVHLQFFKAQQTDDQITTIKTLVETKPHDNYIVKNKLLYKTVNDTDLLVVPDEMQANIIKTAHERGHFAVIRAQDLVSKETFTSHDLMTKLKNAFKTVLHAFSQTGNVVNKMARLTR